MTNFGSTKLKNEDNLKNEEDPNTMLLQLLPSFLARATQLRRKGRRDEEMYYCRGKGDGETHKKNLSDTQTHRDTLLLLKRESPFKF